MLVAIVIIAIILLPVTIIAFFLLFEQQEEATRLNVHVSRYEGSIASLTRSIFDMSSEFNREIDLLKDECKILRNRTDFKNRKQIISRSKCYNKGFQDGVKSVLEADSFEEFMKVVRSAENNNTPC